MAFRRFVRVTSNGAVLGDRLSQDTPSGDWIEVPASQHYLLGRGTHRLRWDDGVGLSEKPAIRLSVGAFMWPADGVSENAISVRGEALGPDTEVTVSVNNTDYTITERDDLMLTSAEPGNYIVRVIDPYFYAIPSEIILTAMEVDDAES